MRDDEYEMQVESEASQYIPFAIDEVNLDFQILGPSAQSADDVDVLLAASRKEKVDDRVVVAEMAGLKPMIIDVEPYAARSSIDHVVSFLPNQGDGLILAVFDIGQMSTSLTVVLNGQTIFERDQAFGGNQLTQDIVRLYGLTRRRSRAQEAHRRPARQLRDRPARAVRRAAAPTTSAGRCSSSSPRRPYTRVDRVLLAGGAAVTPGLAEAVQDRANVPTEILSPFQGMEVADSVREKQMRLDAPALLVSCGLAMRRFDE